MKLRFTGPKPLRALISAQGRSLQLGVAARPIAVVKVTQGLTGRPGTSGEAQISADPDNQLTQGSDQKLFVPHAQAVADPLAYYILASN